MALLSGVTGALGLAAQVGAGGTSQNPGPAAAGITSGPIDQTVDVASAGTVRLGPDINFVAPGLEVGSNRDINPPLQGFENTTLNLLALAAIIAIVIGAAIRR